MACTTEDTEIVLPSTLVCIGTFGLAMADESAKTYVLPESVKSVGKNAFGRCYASTAVFKGKTASEVKRMADYPFGAGKVVCDDRTLTFF